MRCVLVLLALGSNPRLCFVAIQIPSADTNPSRDTYVLSLDLNFWFLRGALLAMTYLTRNID